jgi:hypothetical protein
MRIRFMPRLHLLLLLILLPPALAGTGAAQNAPEEGLHVSSPPRVLQDPLVMHCRQLAARRVDPKLDSMTTAVELAAYQFQLEPIFDAVAACRAALSLYPNEPKVIIAHYNASEALTVLALGLKFPDDEVEIFALARLATQGGPDTIRGIEGQILAFFLGSAYEYGVGTKRDRAEAMKWYAAGAAAGDPIAKRELARLQGNK